MTCVYVLQNPAAGTTGVSMVVIRGRTPYHHQKAKIGTSSTNVIITVYIGFNQPAGKASLRMVSESTCKRKRLEIPFAQSWRTI